MVRYRWKLTNFTTGEKNRAQNCLTVSNIKLDDVFSDVFGKAASAITKRLLENPTEKITDVSVFRTKGMKATDEDVPAAVDGEMCAEQALVMTVPGIRSFAAIVAWMRDGCKAMVGLTVTQEVGFR